MVKHDRSAPAGAHPIAGSSLFTYAPDDNVNTTRASHATSPNPTVQSMQQLGKKGAHVIDAVIKWSVNYK